MKFLRIILFAVLSAGAAGVRAETVVTLEDCLKLSLSESGAARTAAIDEAIAGSRVIQARSIAMPHLGAETTYTRLDELQEIDIGDEVTRLGTLDNYSATMSVDQLLFAGGKVGAALRAAGLTRRYAQLVRSEVDASVEYETSALFNDIILAQESISVLEESVNLLEDLVHQTGLMKHNGKAAEIDVLTAQVRYENEKPQLIRARNNLAVLKERMKKLTGLEGDISFKGGLDYCAMDLKASELVQLAMKERSLIRSYEVMADLRKEDVSSARSDLFPALGAFFRYNGANSYGFVAFGEDEWEWHWSAGLSVKWNIWDGDLSRGVLREKRLEQSKAYVALDEMRKSVRLEVCSALLDIEHAAQTVKAASSNVLRAEKLMEIMKARLESGMATYLDFTDANVSLKTARLSYLSAVRDHLNAAARLKMAAGCDFGVQLNDRVTNGVSHE